MLSKTSTVKKMIEAMAAMVFRVRDRRKIDEPVVQDRRNGTSRQVQKKLRDSIDRFHDAVERKTREMK